MHWANIFPQLISNFIALVKQVDNISPFPSEQMLNLNRTWGGDWKNQNTHGRCWEIESAEYKKQKFFAPSFFQLFNLVLVGGKAKLWLQVFYFIGSSCRPLENAHFLLPPSPFSSSSWLFLSNFYVSELFYFKMYQMEPNQDQRWSRVTRVSFLL